VPRRHFDPAVRRLAAQLLEKLDVLADELASVIADEIPIYGEQPLIARAELTQSLADNMRHILGQLSGTINADLQIPHRLGRRRANQDVPLPEILRAYRLGFTFLWQRLLDAAHDSGPQAMNGLLETATSIWELADEFSSAITDSYRQAMGERMIAADRRRSGVVAALLGGPTTTHRTAWEIAKLLDMPYEGRFLVIIGETPGDGDSPFPHLEDRLRALDVASAWRAQPEHEIGLLSLGRRRTVAEVVAMVGEAETTRVGVSPQFHRLDATPRAVHFAQVALETMPAGAKGVRQLEDSRLSDLLVRDRETTRRFVLRVLRNVLALPDDDRTTLLATAEAWLAAHGSAAEAGKALYCHENTVRHRIHRLEEHLGFSLDDPRNWSDISAALEAIRMFPEMGNRLTDPSTDLF
jgi:hypothetical protein